MPESLLKQPQYRFKKLPLQLVISTTRTLRGPQHNQHNPKTTPTKSQHCPPVKGLSRLSTMMLQDYDLGLSPAASQCQSSYKHITSLGQYRGLAGFMSPTVHGRRQEFVGGHSRILREFCRGSTLPTTSQQNPNETPTQSQQNPNPIPTKPQSNPNKTPTKSQHNSN